MNFDRKKIILTLNKYLAYLINISIIGLLLGVVGTFLYGLYLAITS